MHQRPAQLTTVKTGILCDLDGTVVDSRPEQQRLMCGTLTPAGLRARTADDPTPVPQVLRWLHAMYTQGASITYVTGRPPDPANRRMLTSIGAPPGTLVTTLPDGVPHRTKRDLAVSMIDRGFRLYALDDDPVMHWLYGEIPGVTPVLIPGWRFEDYGTPINPALPDPYAKDVTR